MWQPGWEGSLGENGHMYVCVCIYIYIYLYGWVPFPSTWNYYNIVNQLYSNIKQKVKKKSKPLPGKPPGNLSFLHMSHLFSLCGPAINLSLLQTKVSLHIHTHNIPTYTYTPTHTHTQIHPQTKHPSTHVFKAVFCRPLSLILIIRIWSSIMEFVFPLLPLGLSYWARRKASTSTCPCHRKAVRATRNCDRNSRWDVFQHRGNQLSLPPYRFSCSWCDFYQGLSQSWALEMLFHLPEIYISFKISIKCSLPSDIILPPCLQSDLDLSLNVFIRYLGHLDGGLDRNVSNNEWKQWIR